MPICPKCSAEYPEDAATCPHCELGRNEQAAGEVHGTRGIRWSLWLTIGLMFASSMGLLDLWVGLPLGGLLIPHMPELQDRHWCVQCENNLKQIGRALNQYHESYGTLPPAFVVDENGKRMHSWRVLILPYLEQQALYAEYDFSEPWDGPHNSRLLARRPQVYACPSDPTSAANTNTSYAGALGEHCVFRGPAPVAYQDITDGLSTTIFVGDVQATIPWMKPEDIDIKLFPEIGAQGGFGSHHVTGPNFLMGDGTVGPLEQNLPRRIIDALFTRDGHEPVEKY